jgi:glycosyltransferase involved in cell wall biosynthesis
MLKVSIVLPVLNEASNIEPIYYSLKKIFSNNDLEYEIIFVCDPSRDGTEGKIAELLRLDSRVKGIFLADRAGQTEAIRAGYENSSGNAIISMDADFQDPPEIIIELIRSWQEGHRVVHTRRSNRKADAMSYRLSTNLGYKLLSWLTNGKIKHNVGDFRLVDESILPLILSFKDPNPFWRGITSLPGIESEVISFRRPKRRSGKSKYSFFIGSPSIALRGMVSFSNKPLELLQTVGLFSVIFSTLAMFTIVGLQIFNPSFPRGTPTLIVLLAFFFAIQFVSTAIIATYLIVLIEQTRRRPNYLIVPDPKSK